jgi:hypothetical protein
MNALKQFFRALFSVARHKFGLKPDHLLGEFFNISSGAEPDHVAVAEKFDNLKRIAADRTGRTQD